MKRYFLLPFPLDSTSWLFVWPSKHMSGWDFYLRFVPSRIRTILPYQRAEKQVFEIAVQDIMIKSFYPFWLKILILQNEHLHTCSGPFFVPIGSADRDFSSARASSTAPLKTFEIRCLSSRDHIPPIVESSLFFEALGPPHVRLFSCWLICWEAPRKYYLFENNTHHPFDISWV